MKTEGKCKCGLCTYCQREGWVSYHPGATYCMDCGCFLDDKGWAHEMVRKDSVEEHWKQVEAALDTEMKAAGFTLPQHKSMQEFFEKTAYPFTQEALDRLTEDPADEGSDFDETARPIEDILRELADQVPAEEWAKLPADLTDELDHYLYGTARRKPADPDSEETG